MSPPPHPVLLYDGVCGLCNRSVQFVLRWDRAGVFRFATLQSPLAAKILCKHQLDPAETETLAVVANLGQPDEQLLIRSDAVLYLLRRLAPPWPAVGHVGRLVPRPIRDALYRLVAANRYRIFGRYSSCPLPLAEVRNRFLDAEPPT